MDGIQLNTRLSDQEMAKLNMQVDSFNKSITIEGRKVQRDLGKDDFLKLLITQLSNQDPTSPMENTEFIAQMAQFSSLEQMTNMNQEFAKMNSMLVSSQAVGTIGKTIDRDLPILCNTRCRLQQYVAEGGHSLRQRRYVHHHLRYLRYDQRFRQKRKSSGYTR